MTVTGNRLTHISLRSSTVIPQRGVVLYTMNPSCACPPSALGGIPQLLPKGGLGDSRHRPFRRPRDDRDPLLSDAGWKARLLDDLGRDGGDLLEHRRIGGLGHRVERVVGATQLTSAANLRSLNGPPWL